MLRKDIHRQHLYNIIIDIFRSPYSKILAFKGGTASYFLHGLSRFSTDIDLDLLGNRTAGDNIDDALAELLKKYGKVKKGHQLILSYGENDTNINVDISRKIWKNNKYDIVNFFGQDIMVQDISTIVANKMVALIERRKNRDFFDTRYFLTQAYPVNEAVVYERTGKDIVSLYHSIIEYIDILSLHHKILDELGETLYDEKQKAWVKKYLLSDLKGICQMRIHK